MKKFRISKIASAQIILIIFSLLCSCSTQSKLSNKSDLSSVESKFVGSWSGNEIMHNLNAPRYWIQHRFEDGTFVLINIVIMDGEIHNFSLKGKWWIKDGQFCERASNADKDDIYDFEIIDKDNIRFIGVGMENLSKDNEKYEFIDTRVEYME